jgi:DNA polymerase IV
MADRCIAYLSAPHFAATLAQRAEPGLAGRPFFLLDDNGQVLAADLLAGRAGVTAGQTERQAIARCPAALVRPAVRYPIYESQARLTERIAQYAGRWQPSGLGCVYLDTAGIGGDLAGWCQTLGAEVRRFGAAPALGLTSSKFGALVAGQMAGQNAFLRVAASVQRSFLADQPVALLPLGPDTLLHLRHLGISKLGQYARLPPAGVLVRFGEAGRTAQRWSLGQDDRPVILPSELPQASARIEFDPPVESHDILLAALMERAARLLAPLHARLQAIGRLWLDITRADGRSFPASHIFPLPTALTEAVRAALSAALDRVIWGGEGAAEVTLTLADITDAPAQQLALFDTPTPRALLTATLDRLAARFGAETFQMAVLADTSHPLPERRASWRTFD